MVKNVTLREAWSGEADCLNCSLRTSVLFAGLEEADFERIHDPIDQFLIKPGTAMYHSGDRGDHMFTVRSGTLKLVQYLPDGGQRIVRLARTTDVIGLEALIENPPPGHDARSREHPPRNGFRPSLVAIVGGQHKDVSLDDCAKMLATHCRAVICTGESGPAFTAAVKSVAPDQVAVVVIEVDRLEGAVRRARAEAQPGDTVLFSPGAPSFDRYANYAERGRCFAEAVTGL